MKVLLIFIIGTVTAGCTSVRGSFIPAPRELKRHQLVNIPLDQNHWDVVSTGEGRILYQSEGLTLEPKTPRFTKETFGAWVVAKESALPPTIDYVVRLEVTTYRQLRKGPHDWEVFWFFGNYRSDPKLLKETNYFIAKPKTGGELGRAYQEVGQEFLKTAEQPKLVLGKKTEFVYVKRGDSFKVYQNGRLAFEFLGAPGERGLYQHPGTFGLYSEDALVTIHSFSYHPL